MTSNFEDYIIPFQPKINNTDDIYNVTFVQTNSSLKIWYFNARSIVNKTEEVQHILNEIKKKLNVKYLY